MPSGGRRGRAHAPRPHERPADALAARHGPRLDRRPGGARPHPGRGGREPRRRSGASATWSACVAFVETTRPVMTQPARARGRLARLGPRALHHGRGLGAGRAGRLQAALRRRPGLSRGGTHQLVPGVPYQRVGPGGHRHAGDGHAVDRPLPPPACRRQPRPRGLDRRRHHAPRDDPRRHGRGRAPRGRALRRARRAPRADPLRRARRAGHRRRCRWTASSARARSRSRPAHDQTDLRDRRSATACRRSRCSTTRLGSAVPGALRGPRPLRGAAAHRGRPGGARRPGRQPPRTRWSSGAASAATTSSSRGSRRSGSCAWSPSPRRPSRPSATGGTRIVPRALREGLLRLAGEHPRLEREPPAVVGPPHPGVVLPGRPRDGRPSCARGPGRLRRRAAGRRPSCEQDPDIFDTWFSSGLWPFSTLGWPDPDGRPGALLPGLGDGDRLRHHLLLGRADDDAGRVADRARRRSRRSTSPASCATRTGQKMSKTKGNVVDPLGVIDEHRRRQPPLRPGQRRRPGRRPAPRPHALEGARNFGNKLWNAARFVLGARPAELPADAAAGAARPSASSGPAEHWMLAELARRPSRPWRRPSTSLQLGEATRLLHEAIWSTYCDWYLELAKARLADPTREPRRPGPPRGGSLAWVLDRYLRLLHPVMPFVTEAIWQRLPHARRGSGAAHRGRLAGRSAERAPGRLRPRRPRPDALLDLVRAVRNARAEAAIGAGERLAAELTLPDERSRAAYVSLAGPWPALVGWPGRAGRTCPCRVWRRCRPARAGGEAARLHVLAGRSSADLRRGGADLTRERARLERELGDAGAARGGGGAAGRRGVHREGAGPGGRGCPHPGGGAAGARRRASRSAWPLTPRG